MTFRTNYVRVGLLTKKESVKMEAVKISNTEVLEQTFNEYLEVCKKLETLSKQKEAIREWLSKYVQKFGQPNETGNPSLVYQKHKMTYVRREGTCKIQEPRALSLLEEKGLLGMASITTRRIVESSFMDLVTGNKITAEEYLSVVDKKEPSFFLDVKRLHS